MTEGEQDMELRRNAISVQGGGALKVCLFVFRGTNVFIKQSGWAGRVWIITIRFRES